VYDARDREESCGGHFAAAPVPETDPEVQAGSTQAGEANATRPVLPRLAGNSPASATSHPAQGSALRKCPRLHPAATRKQSCANCFQPLRQRLSYLFYTGSPDAFRAVSSRAMRRKKRRRTGT
jgi:hypothetical protein